MANPTDHHKSSFVWPGARHAEPYLPPDSPQPKPADIPEVLELAHRITVVSERISGALQDSDGERLAALATALEYLARSLKVLLVERSRGRRVRSRDVVSGG